MNASTIFLFLFATIVAVNGLKCIRKRSDEKLNPESICEDGKACTTYRVIPKGDRKESIFYGCGEKKDCHGGLDGCLKTFRHCKMIGCENVEEEFCCCSTIDFCNITPEGIVPEASGQGATGTTKEKDQKEDANQR